MNLSLAQLKIRYSFRLYIILNISKPIIRWVILIRIIKLNSQYQQVVLWVISAHPLAIIRSSHWSSQRTPSMHSVQNVEKCIVIWLVFLSSVFFHIIIGFCGNYKLFFHFFSSNRSVYSTISQPHFLEKWDVTGFCATSGQIVCARVTFIALWVRELKRKKSELERERELKTHHQKSVQQS